MNQPPDPEPRVDRSAFSIVSSFDEADAADDAYWRSRTPAERLAHLELLRRINDGDAATGRLKEFLSLLGLHGVRYLLIGDTRSTTTATREPQETLTSGSRLM